MTLLRPGNLYEEADSVREMPNFSTFAVAINLSFTAARYDYMHSYAFEKLDCAYAGMATNTTLVAAKMICTVLGCVILVICVKATIFEQGNDELAVLAPKSNCIKTALIDLFPECKTESLTDDQRIQYSVQLSVCEFEASKVTYPHICQPPADFNSCTRELESRPQWWTTYSGYYRLIGQLCLEYQRDYELENTLAFHKNVHSVEERLYFNLLNALDQLSVQDDYSQRGLEMYQDMVEKFVTVEKVANRTLSLYDEFTGRSMDLFHKMDADIARKLDALSEAFNMLHLIVMRNVKMSRKVGSSLESSNSQLAYNIDFLNSTFSVLNHLSTRYKDMSLDLAGNSELVWSTQKILENTNNLANSTLASHTRFLAGPEPRYFPMLLTISVLLPILTLVVSKFQKGVTYPLMAIICFCVLSVWCQLYSVVALSCSALAVVGWILFRSRNAGVTKGSSLEMYY